MRFRPTVGLALAAPLAPQASCDQQQRRVGCNVPRRAPFYGRHDQVVTARVAPQPEPVAQRLDRQRGNATPGVVVLRERVPGHAGMMVPNIGLTEWAMY